MLLDQALEEVAQGGRVETAGGTRRDSAGERLEYGHPRGGRPTPDFRAPDAAYGQTILVTGDIRPAAQGRR